MSVQDLDELAKKRAIWALLGIIFLVIPVAIFMGSIKLNNLECNIEIVDGRAVVDICDDQKDVVHTLNGDWMCVDNVYIDSVERLYLLDGSEMIKPRTLPESRLSEVKQERTYLIDLEFTTEISDTSRLAIAIPFLYDDTKIFLNGIKLEPYEPFESWMGTKTEFQLYLLRDYILVDNEVQNLVISVNENGSNYGLYKREVMISDIASFYQHMQAQDGLQNLLVGMMIICILMGWINMLILPRHNMLTSMTMFDTTLMLYFFFEVCKLPIYTFNMLHSDVYGEWFIRSMVLALLCSVGYWGNRLSRDIFDPKIEVMPKKDLLIGRIWLVGAVINLIFPQYYGSIAICITLLFYTFTIEILIKRILYCKKKGLYTPVLKLQAYKAMYVGALLGYDILTTNTYPRNNTLLIIGYSIFFFLEFLMRANVQREAFVRIKDEKNKLEEKVQDRTRELKEVNNNLLELMHIDPLTNAYNRLYFESTLLEEVESMVNESDINYHMCIFDLDNFKNINDTFGHQIGDEQLIEAVESTKNVIQNDGIISRIGGEEFMILFKDMTDLQVVLIVENVRLALEKHSKREQRTTGSFGVTRFRSDDTRKSAFVRVDQCLYHSKNNGKNCITYEFDERKIFDSSVTNL